jgi:hypothetical protein
MTRRSPITHLPLVGAVLLAACAGGDGVKTGVTPPETRWRLVTTAQDRDRLRNWRNAWVDALPRATAADPAAIRAGGALFDPDRALGNAMPPTGDYRCRTFKLGAQRPEFRDFTAYPWFNCKIGHSGEMPSLAKLDGAQRPVGRLYAETDSRVIFLGALELGDETVPLAYGIDERRDMAGYVERIGTQRWRLVLPWPTFESQLDVIELIPG